MKLEEQEAGDGCYIYYISSDLKLHFLSPFEAY